MSSLSKTHVYLFIYLYLHLSILFMVYLCTYAVFLLSFFSFWILDQSIVSFSVVFVEQFHAQKYLFIYLFIVFLSFFCVDCSLFLLLLLLLIGKTVVFATKAKNDFCSIKSLWECKTDS